VDEYKTTIEAIGGGLGALFLVLFRKFVLTVIGGILTWTKERLSKSLPEDAGLVDIQDYLELRDQCVVAMDRLGADRVSIYQLHNKDHYISGQPSIKLSCTFEVPKAGFGSLMDLVQSVQITKLLDSPLLPLVNKVKKVPGIYKVDCVKNCPNKGDMDRCKLDLFGVYWLIASQLPEGFWKTHMAGNHIVATLLSPLRNDNEELVGFVTADYTDDRYGKEDGHPELSYLLCFLARNSWDFLSRMRKPPPGPPRRRSGGYRPPPLPLE
jgi:hypothetical protein